MKNLRYLFCVALALVSSLPALAGFTGTAPEDGGSYYLYNVYQAKFLCAGNTWGTQASVGNDSPLLCTVETSGTYYTLSTNYNSDATNLLGVVDGEAWVDRSSSDGSNVQWTFSSGDEGYTLTCLGSSSALMFGAGTACTMGSTSEGFNADKALWLFVDEDEYKTYTEKKRFTFAALNVDGMPQTLSIYGLYTLTLNSDGKGADGATAIGTKVATMGYDVVGLSEDFNYHDELMEALQAANSNYECKTHQGSIEVYTGIVTDYVFETSPLFDIDGLGLLYNSTTNTPTKESIVSWNEHYGYANNGADGLIDKGYRYYLITLKDDTEIDLYIMHMDAETDDGDLAARASQLTQLANAIIASDNKRPIIVMGDTNCRYTRDRVKSLFIDVLNADSRFTVTDPWITYGRQGIYPVYGSESIMASSEGYRQGEVVDKLFMINNTDSDIRLVAESYRQDLSFVNDTLAPLADHWPCVVEFSYHDYDPTVDDVVDDSSFDGKTYYLKNAETGYYLKSGGWWGTHAVQGNYGIPIELAELSNGKYVLTSPMGYVAGTDPYMDSGTYTEWTMLQGEDGYVFYVDGKALTANDATTFSYGPNTRYVTTADLDITDKYQQWELVTSDDILSDARFATVDNPINLTHLMPGANFDRNDTQSIEDNWLGWPTTATKMTYNYADGTVDIEQGNYVAEVYVQSYSGSTTYGTTWDIYQSLTSVPNGHYTLTAQAFQRVNYETKYEDEMAQLYANKDSVSVKYMYSIECTEDIGTTTSGSYFYPDSMSQAALFFNRGYYENTVGTDVEDGSLTVGIRKYWTTKGSSVWTCFDNFQINYYPTSPLLRGDMDSDGEITILDVAMLVDYLQGNTSGGDVTYDAGIADVDENHVVDSRDVAALRNKLLGKTE